MQDKDLNEFPFRLNKEIRCLRNTNRDAIVRETFVKVRNIIDKSLDIFGMRKYQVLYRGMTSWNFYDRKYFVEEGYFSTSTDPTPALKFANGKYFLIVEGMYGLEIAEYVQDKFKYQKEVLGKSGKMFEIIKKINDSAQITQILTNLAVNKDKLVGIAYPHTIVYIKEVSIPNMIQSVINQQWTSMENYCSVDDSPNVSSEVKGATIIQTICFLLSFYFKLNSSL